MRVRCWIAALALAAAGAAAAEPPDAALYRAARAELARGAYRPAAAAFAELARLHPESPHAGDALYWQAFALYKTGDTEALREAKRALEAQAERYPRAATHADARVLDTRVCGELARRGSARCAEQIASTAARPCRSEEDDLLLAALDEMESPQVVPLLRTVLERQDTCSERVRKRAVLLMAENEPQGSVDILLDVIREDPSADVRLQAVTLLPDLPSPRVVGVLDSLVRSAGDEELRRRAVAGIGDSGPGGRRILRRLVEEPDAGEDVRAAAIAALARSAEPAADATFLRDVYARLGSRRLREHVIEALGALPSAASRRFLVDVALDAREPLPLRRSALFAAGQSSDPAEIARLYDRLPEPEMREQALYVLGTRGGRAALDKLAQVAAGDADANLRAKAAFWLAQLGQGR